jgi:uncharacterized protein (TIGR02145 family)
MAENLDYNTGNSWCYDGYDYNKGANISNGCGTYGRLYDWETAKKACPSGWHLPSSEEWTTLVDYAGGMLTAGTKLKSKSGWASYSGVPVGTDNYGFSALPGGYRYYYAGYGGYWWTATEDSSGNACYWIMYYRNEYVLEDNDIKSNGFSVRCLHD